MMWLLSEGSGLTHYKLFLLGPVSVAAPVIGICANKLFLRWPVVLQETYFAMIIILIGMFMTEIFTNGVLYAENRFVAAWNSLYWLFCLLMCGVFAADWARFKDTRRRSEMLQNKFTGRLPEAQCSADADRASIHHEVFESGKLHEVEVAVNTLLRVNLLTPELLRAAALVGEIGDNSTCPRAIPLMALSCWFVIPIDTLFYPQFQGRLLEQVLFVVMSIEAACWMVMFKRSPLDRRIFATYPLPLWIFCEGTIVALQYVAPWPLAYSVWMWYPKIAAFCFGPFCLFILIAGPIRVAHVPLVGHMLVRRALRGRMCSRKYLATAKRDSLRGTAEPRPSTSTFSIYGPVTRCHSSSLKRWAALRARKQCTA